MRRDFASSSLDSATVFSWVSRSLSAANMSLLMTSFFSSSSSSILSAVNCSFSFCNFLSLFDCRGFLSVSRLRVSFIQSSLSRTNLAFSSTSACISVASFSLSVVSCSLSLTSRLFSARSALFCVDSKSLCTVTLTFSTACFFSASCSCFLSPCISSRAASRSIFSCLCLRFAEQAWAYSYFRLSKWICEIGPGVPLGP